MRFSITMMLFIFLVGCVSSTVRQNDTRRFKTAKTNVQLGLGYLEEGETDRAKQKLLVALRQAPDLPEAQLAMGYYWATVKEPSMAEGYYQEALSLAPQSGQIQNDYGIFLCQQGRYALAMHYFKLAGENRSYSNRAQAYENASRCAGKNSDKNAESLYIKKSLNLHFNP